MEREVEFKISESQVAILCEHFEKDVGKLDDWEICELLDKLIDETAKQ